MPDRRPYASRGVPRRITTRYRGRARPIRALLLLCAVAAALVIGTSVAAFNAFAARTSPTSFGATAAQSGSANAAGAGQQTGAGTRGGDASLANPVAAATAQPRSGSG